MTERVSVSLTIRSTPCAHFRQAKDLSRARPSALLPKLPGSSGVLKQSPQTQVGPIHQSPGVCPFAANWLGRPHPSSVPCVCCDLPQEQGVGAEERLSLVVIVGKW